MANKRILCDKTELVLMVLGKKKASVVNLTYEQIINIRVEPVKEFKLFRYVPSERIVIARKKGDPIIYRKSQEKKYFEEYKQELKRFAADHRIVFHDLPA